MKSNLNRCCWGCLEGMQLSLLLTTHVLAYSVYCHQRARPSKVRQLAPCSLWNAAE